MSVFVSRFVRMTLLLAALVALSTRADAATITVDAIGDAFTVQYSGYSNQDPIHGYPVSVESSWLTTVYTSTEVQFQVTFTNTSPTSPSQVTAFGFNPSPDATGGTSDSLLFPFVSLFPNGSFTFDVCVQGPPNNASCAGNSGDPDTSLGAGASDTFLLTLTFLDTGTGVTLSDFGARLQGIGGNGASAKIYGDPTPGCIVNCDPPPNCTDNCDISESDLSPVPEPGSMLLLGSGALVVFRRRFRKK
jgi:hypothetical protein